MISVEILACGMTCCPVKVVKMEIALFHVSTRIVIGKVQSVLFSVA